MWGIRHGSWWAVQWRFDGCLSLGLHFDFVSRQGAAGKYGPYLDIHFLVLTISVGRNPAYSGDLERALSISRGGLEP